MLQQSFYDLIQHKNQKNIKYKSRELWLVVFSWHICHVLHGFPCFLQVVNCEGSSRCLLCPVLPIKQCNCLVSSQRDVQHKVAWPCKRWQRPVDVWDMWMSCFLLHEVCGWQAAPSYFCALQVSEKNWNKLTSHPWHANGKIQKLDFHFWSPPCAKHLLMLWNDLQRSNLKDDSESMSDRRSIQQTGVLIWSVFLCWDDKALSQHEERRSR